MRVGIDYKIVTAAKYQKGFMGDDNKSVMATIDGVVCFVPINTENMDYQAILAWAAIDGNTIADAD
tara:strand:+ start:504 stop:701 length:198 start_codon:yes stop_codon:yes gene_type:complete